VCESASRSRRNCVTCVFLLFCFSPSWKTPSNTGLRASNSAVKSPSAAGLTRRTTKRGYYSWCRTPEQGQHRRNWSADGRPVSGCEISSAGSHFNMVPLRRCSSEPHSTRGRLSNYECQSMPRSRPNAAAGSARRARSFLISLLRWFEDVVVIGEAKSGKEAVAVIERERPDLVLLDWQMPELDGMG